MKNSFFKKGTLYFVNTIIGALITVISTKIFAIYISPEEYGVYSVFYSFYAMIVNLLFITFSQSSLRLYYDYEKDDDKKQKFFGTYFLTLLIIFFIIAVIVIFILPLFKEIIGENLYYSLFLLFGVLLIPDGLKEVMFSFERCKEKPVKELLGNSLNMITKLLVFFLIFFIINKSVVSIVWGSICGSIVCCIFLINKKYIKSVSFKNFDKDLLKKIFAYGLPLVGVPIVNYLLSTSDQLIIKLICSDYDTGVYAMGYKISHSLFSLITSFLITAGHPIIMKLYKKFGMEKASEFTIRLSFLYFAICLPCLVEVLVFNNYVISILSSSAYNDSAFVLVVASFGIVLAGYINYCNKPWEITLKSGMITVFSLVGAIANVVLNFIFVPIYGFNAAAVTTIVSYFIVVVLSRICSRKIMKLSLPFKDMIILILINGALFGYLYMMNYFVSNIFHFILVAASGLIIYCIIFILLFKKNIQYFKKINIIGE